MSELIMQIALDKNNIILVIFNFICLTPTSAVAKSDGFLCDNRATACNTKKRRFWQSAGCSYYVFF